MSGDGKRNARLSLMRVAACVGIVLLHTANVSEILYRDTMTTGDSFLTMGIVYCMMWAVPCFLMVSGALLLDPDRDITLRKVFGRYIKRVFTALLIFCLLFRLFDMLMDGEGFSAAFVTDGLYRMFTGKSWAHLWYLYLLIGLYILLPFYRIIAARCSDALLKYLLAVYIIFLSVLPLTGLVGAVSAFEIQTASIYPFYFFCGYAIMSGKLKLKRGAAIAMALIGTAAIVFMTFLQYYTRLGAGDALRQILGSYSSLTVAVQSVGIFALCCGPAGVEAASTGEGAKVNGAGPSAWRDVLLERLDLCGFGIYLVHMVFIRLFLRYMGLNPFNIGGWSVLIMAAAIYLLSCAAVMLLRAIPAVRRLL